MRWDTDDLGRRMQRIQNTAYDRTTVVRDVELEGFRLMTVVLVGGTMLRPPVHVLPPSTVAIYFQDIEERNPEDVVVTLGMVPEGSVFRQSSIKVLVTGLVRYTLRPDGCETLENLKTMAHLDTFALMDSFDADPILATRPDVCDTILKYWKASRPSICQDLDAFRDKFAAAYPTYAMRMYRVIGTFMLPYFTDEPRMPDHPGHFARAMLDGQLDHVFMRPMEEVIKEWNDDDGLAKMAYDSPAAMTFTAEEFEHVKTLVVNMCAAEGIEIPDKAGYKTYDYLDAYTDGLNGLTRHLARRAMHHYFDGLYGPVGAVLPDDLGYVTRLVLDGVLLHDIEDRERVGAALLDTCARQGVVVPKTVDIPAIPLSYVKHAPKLRGL